MAATLIALVLAGSACRPFSEATDASVPTASAADAGVSDVGDGGITDARPVDASAPNVGPQPLRVMSFNLRYGSASDGTNRWSRRRQMVFDRIEAFDPDLLGAQEVEWFQADELAAHFTGYTFVGVGRDDGVRAGEMTAILYKTDRFEALDQGHFWLSETPTVAGSKSWDSSLTRMASWVHVRDRSNGEQLHFFNTHFDHRGAEARRQSAALIRSRIEQLGAGAIAVLTGDFNAEPGSAPHRVFVDPPALLVDAWIDANPGQTPPGTFNGFGATSNGGPHIDWILRTDGLRTESAHVDGTRPMGLWPSDHDPVLATFSYR